MNVDSFRATLATGLGDGGRNILFGGVNTGMLNFCQTCATVTCGADVPRFDTLKCYDGITNQCTIDYCCKVLIHKISAVRGVFQPK